MNNARSRRLAVLLWGISLILLGCGQQDSSFTATPTSSPAGQVTEQPGVETPPATLTPTPIATLEVTPLAPIPYPEPRQGAIVTKEPIFEPSITPTEGPLSTATPSALPTEAGNPSLPPPYPGEGTQLPTGTQLNPPPYPITTRTLTPTPTQGTAGSTATNQPGITSTPTLAEEDPTATTQPEVTPTPNATPTPTLTPTITPTPRPRIEPREVAIPCFLDEGQLRCEDGITDLAFDLPSEWVLAISGNLHPGETGIQYGYDFQRPLNAQPGMLQAGGLSRDFTDGREGLLTDFAGFQADSVTERCSQFQGAQICEPINEEVLRLFVFPDAERLCLDGPQFLGRPLVLIAVDLPENELINGFVFAGDFLSTARLAEYDGDLEDLLESEELPGEPCDGYRKSRFTVRMLELVAAVRNEILDILTLEKVAQWRQLGESLQPLED